MLHAFHLWLLSRPDPGRADTWQPSRALEWDPVSQAPSKDSQGLGYTLAMNLPHHLRFNNLLY